MHTSAQTPNATPGCAAPRTALAIGTVGRIGEALVRNGRVPLEPVPE